MDTVLGQLLVVLVTLHLLLYGVGMVIGGNDLGSRLNKKLWNFLIGQGRRFLRGILHLVIRSIRFFLRHVRQQLVRSYHRVRNAP